MNPTAALQRVTDALRKTLAGLAKAGLLDEPALRRFETMAKDVIRGWLDVDPDAMEMRPRCLPLLKDLEDAAKLVSVHLGPVTIAALRLTVIGLNCEGADRDIQIIRGEVLPVDSLAGRES